MRDIPPEGITCGGRCGRAFKAGDRYVELLTAGTLPHPVTGEPTDCYLLYCPDCARKVAA